MILNTKYLVALNLIWVHCKLNNLYLYILDSAVWVLSASNAAVIVNITFDVVKELFLNFMILTDISNLEILIPTESLLNELA